MTQGKRKTQPMANLSARLHAILLVIVLLLAVLLMVIAGSYAGAQLSDDQGRVLSNLADRLANQIDQAIAERWYDIARIADARVLSVDDDPAAQRQRLEALAAAFNEYAWIGLTDSDGHVLVATGKMLEGANVSARPWWQEARQQRYVGDIHEALLLESKLGNANTEPLRFVDFAAPVHDETGAFDRVLGAHLYLRWMKDLANAVGCTGNRRVT